MYVVTVLNILSSLLDDGIVQGWNQTIVDYNCVDTTIHPNNWFSRGWSLVHQAAVVTYPHHDANGENTWISIMSGTKFWCLIIPKPPYHQWSRRRFRDLVLHLCAYQELGLQFPLFPEDTNHNDSSFTPVELSFGLNDICDIEVVVLRPGDML